MSIINEGPPRPYPLDIDPSFRDQADGLFDSIQWGRENSLRRRRIAGMIEKRALALDAGTFLEMNLLPQILDADTKPDGFSFDDNAAEKGEMRGALWVKYPDSVDGEYGFSNAIVMIEGGVLLQGSADRSFAGEVDSFFFQDATEVSLEEYPLYVDTARKAMEERAKEVAGITKEEYRLESERRLAEEIAGIERENKLYENKTDFHGLSSPEISRKAQEHLDQIAALREMAEEEGSTITPEQLSNALRHVFLAQEVSTNKIDEAALGALELTFVAGSLIATVHPGMGERFYGLIYGTQKSPSGSSYMLRRVLQIPYQDTPENEDLFEALKENHFKRAHETGKVYSMPEFGQIPDQFESPDGSSIAREEVVNWLLNTPPSV